ncbi:MAG TPA: histidine phosphatase family protein [candidate division Zixibacteria bacterium]|nr:histidine phosphatase family protein [candidate division Zixibacteria bacterium]
MKVVLIRHGQSEGNVAQEIQGQKDYPLSKKGVEQAHKAGKDLKETYIFDRIYSSDLQRAAKTAELIASYFNITEITFTEKLRELNFGFFQGKKSLKLTEEEKAYFNFCWENVSKRFPGGETVEELSTRVMEAFTEIINTNTEDSTILIICHRRTLFCLLKQILGTVPIVTDDWFQNCSINELLRNNSTEKWQLIRFDNKYL